METTAVESSEPPEILASSENPVLEAEVPTVEQMDTSDVAPASPSASAPVQSTVSAVRSFFVLYTLMRLVHSWTKVLATQILEI